MTALGEESSGAGGSAGEKAKWGLRTGRVDTEDPARHDQDGIVATSDAPLTTTRAGTGGAGSDRK